LLADKSPSIWDVYCEVPGVVKDGTNAKDACKSYQYYKRDVAMLKFLGVDFYRFSISWPRVLPSGFPDKISKEGSEYYSKLIDELLANDIEPVVTIYHWDLPQTLQDLGIFFIVRWNSYAMTNLKFSSSIESLLSLVILHTIFLTIL
jgi:beta-glucosidase